MKNSSAALAPSPYPAIHTLCWNWGSFLLVLEFIIHFTQTLVLLGMANCFAINLVARKLHAKQTFCLPEWSTVSTFRPLGTRDVI
jgi:hypothetical protein